MVVKPQIYSIQLSVGGIAPHKVKPLQLCRCLEVHRVSIQCRQSAAHSRPLYADDHHPQPIICNDNFKRI